MINDLPPSQQPERHQRSTKAKVSIIASSASVFFVIIAFVFGTIYLNWLNRGNPNPSDLGPSGYRILTDEEAAEYEQEIEKYSILVDVFFGSAIVGVMVSIIGIAFGIDAKRDIKQSEGNLNGAPAARWGVILGILSAIVGVIEFGIMVSVFFYVLFMM
jgi:hypothetical protein